MKYVSFVDPGASLTHYVYCRKWCPRLVRSSSCGQALYRVMAPNRLGTIFAPPPPILKCTFSSERPCVSPALTTTVHSVRTPERTCVYLRRAPIA
ncbi:hypothetical protein BJV74DRAFT_84061 [Russula compacta]|nr:hypothetical protein BJV74DRAFT_84061 [Russula compacta]